jgi:hypothetical protein
MKFSKPLIKLEVLALVVSCSKTQVQEGGLAEIKLQVPADKDIDLTAKTLLFKVHKEVAEILKCL